MPFLNVNQGGNIYYETYGFEAIKPCIVFLNGTLQTTIYWRPQVNLFKSRYRILVYDARTQGASDLGQEAPSLRMHLADLLALLDHLAIRKADMVGLSHGAYLALALAANHPQRVRRLVLGSIGAQKSARASTAVRSWQEILERQDMEAMVWAAVPIFFGEQYLVHKLKSLERLVKTIVRRNKGPALKAHLASMETYPPASTLAKKIRAPALILSGAEDPIVGEAAARALAQSCRGRHKTIEGASHSFPAEAPETFTRLVASFLSAPMRRVPKAQMQFT
jgi:pimeloyl-ACP methyl ester carboxylesterase